MKEVKKAFPKLAKMHRHKESFRTIFEDAKDWRDGVLQILDWLQDAQKTFQDIRGCFKRVVLSLKYDSVVQSKIHKP
ncbi:hypothetical protein DO97_04785 [Neosynechococcus sphagnicola sy1]|uniref:Transposase IS204/IS1001/IS1096/IS1165 DDE domain-containing protein n=1 Tax=Neosynechococcus sphagnicola sy1 TaxID=1497020 RepID=A0A098TKI9_9CYAN|nr:hypothetical protein DO97_04785 [Neosynechococcus sphagnicola sy1]